MPSRKGWITDFVYYLRGMEVPTSYAVWAGLWTLACTFKRELWIPWADAELYPNLYVILVGTAGLVKKTTAITKADEILLRMPRYIRNKSFQKLKTITRVKNKATPEAILEAIESTSHIVMKDDDGNVLTKEDGSALRVPKSSELALVIPEMSVMFNRQTYNESLVQNLLDLYDPHEEWEWRTKTGGKKVLRNLCTSMLAGTTLAGFQDSIPSAALGDGFISRSIIVYEFSSERCFDDPMVPIGAPDREELARRLAWLAENRSGSAKTSDEARHEYKVWYRRNHEYLKEHPDEAGISGRKSVMIRKVAMLMAAQRYDQPADEVVIELEDFRDAQRMVNAVFRSSPAMLGEIKGSDAQKKIARVRNYMYRRFANDGKAEFIRTEIMRNMHLDADSVDFALKSLFHEGAIEIVGSKGQKETVVKRAGQTFRWVGDGSDGQA